VITVAAVVVTRNRPALLKRCLEAIDAQTYPVSQLVVLDNASDEPTRACLLRAAANKRPVPAGNGKTGRGAAP